MRVPMTPLESRRRAERFFGGRVGVIDGQKRFTYTEFGDRSRRGAAAPQNVGAQPGEVVSFLTCNTHHPLEGYYGCLQAGAVLNPVNLGLRPEQIAAILAHAECRVLLTPRCAAAERELVECCRERLARFQAPKSVELRDAPPKGGTGKILKAELREPCWAAEARRVR